MVGGDHVAVEQAAQRRQRGGELADDAHRPVVDIVFRRATLAGGVAQLQTHLGEQIVERGVEGMADVEVLALLAQVAGPEAHGEQRTAQGLEDLRHRLPRRQLAATQLTNPAGAAAPLATHGAQLGDDPLQLPVQRLARRLLPGIVKNIAMGIGHTRSLSAASGDLPR
ncbi:hypothetical protein D9M70_489020 [compost metagenome]